MVHSEIMAKQNRLAALCLVFLLQLVPVAVQGKCLCVELVYSQLVLLPC